MLLEEIVIDPETLCINKVNSCVLVCWHNYLSILYFNVCILSFIIQNLTPLQTSSSRLVRQYQYKFNDLPECSNEESVLAFVEFVVQCNQWHATSKGKTLIVLCRFI